MYIQRVCSKKKTKKNIIQQPECLCVWYLQHSLCAIDGEWQERRGQIPLSHNFHLFSIHIHLQTQTDSILWCPDDSQTQDNSDILL